MKFSKSQNDFGRGHRTHPTHPLSYGTAMFNEECLMFTATTFIHFIFLYPLHHLHPCIVTRFIVFILHCAENEEILNGKLHFLCSARFPYDTHLQVAALCTHLRSVFLLHYFWFH